jgi:hypothetical protein
MKKLKLIRDFILVAKVGLFVGLVVIAFFLVTTKNGVFVPVSDPHLHITSEQVKNTLYDALFQSRPPVKGEPVLTSISTADLSLKVDGSFKALVAVIFVLGTAYIFWGLELFKRIIKSVEDDNSFSIGNIGRVKLAGALVMLAPVFEWVLRMGFMAWINSKLTFEGMTLTSDADYGISISIVGLLIIVLGIAFEQAQKLQEEHELTI